MTMSASADRLPVRFVCDKCGACFDTSLVLADDRGAIALECGGSNEVRLACSPDPLEAGWSSWRLGGRDPAVFHMCAECTAAFHMCAERTADADAGGAE